MLSSQTLGNDIYETIGVVQGKPVSPSSVAAPGQDAAGPPAATLRGWWIEGVNMWGGPRHFLKTQQI